MVLLQAGASNPEYRVHMAVFTSNLGKRVAVGNMNLLMSTLAAALLKHGGSVSKEARRDEVTQLFLTLDLDKVT